MFLLYTLLLMISPPIISIFMNKHHLLMSLLLFESLILAMVASMFMLFIYSNLSHLFLILVMLTMGACEASLGLACLVKMMRSFGNDLLMNSSMLKC
uniref:NADH-ubiquinone oxidoreductase chain 4L n=1 Tax=Myrianida brachycephala TaxID=884646 RepID=A0A1C9UZE0_MYRBC|nr:NADH dehydrogenase subunit 4L [Myrianida brachycephala]AOR87134.1 NADH dehydrogenase subunit 4L [Myrianida brachycephala]